MNRTIFIETENIFVAVDFIDEKKKAKKKIFQQLYFDLNWKWQPNKEQNFNNSCN